MYGLVEQQRGACVEQSERQPELAAIVLSASLALKWSCSSSAASPPCVDEAEQIPGLRDTREKLLCELQGFGKRPRRRPRPPERRARVRVAPRSPFVVEAGRARSRTRSSPSAWRRSPALPRRDLGDEGNRAGLDVRQERIEQPLWASGVLPGEERLLELGDDPHDALSRDGVDQSLHASLQLPDVDRAERIERVRGARALFTLRQAPDLQRLEQRVLGFLVVKSTERADARQGSDRDLDELASSTDEESRWIVERPIPDPLALRSVRCARQRSARPDVWPEVGLGDR
jgi:hypothetical protein